MGINTKIEWADHSLSGWWGCTPVSPECANCYAESLSNKFNMAEYKKGADRKIIKSFAINATKLNNAAFESNRKATVFWSLSDPFDPEVPTSWFKSAADVVEDTEYLRWIWLTKRPECILSQFAKAYPNLSRISQVTQDFVNLNLGISAGTQSTLNRMLESFTQVKTYPRSRRILSAEPLLEKITIHDSSSIDYVIIGGESGPRARPCEPEWINDLCNQCAYYGIDFFVKQLGTYYAKKHKLKHPKAGNPDEWPTNIWKRDPL